MPDDLQATATEYLGRLQLEANRSPNTVRAYESEIRKLLGFLAGHGHTLKSADLRHEDLRAYQRHLATRLKSPASRARALVAIRSWLRWIAREGLIERDLSNGITLPKLEQRLPKPIDPDELTRLLSALPRDTPLEKRDRALVQFLVSTGCRISEALALDRTDDAARGDGGRRPPDARGPRARQPQHAAGLYEDRRQPQAGGIPPLPGIPGRQEEGAGVVTAGGHSAYDEATGQVVLYGGSSDQPQPFSETWVRDGSTWSLWSPTAGA